MNFTPCSSLIKAIGNPYSPGQWSIYCPAAAQDNHIFCLSLSGFHKPNNALKVLQEKGVSKLFFTHSRKIFAKTAKEYSWKPPEFRKVFQRPRLL
jgi:hypothetical protein